MADRTDSLNGWIWADGAGDPPAVPVTGVTYATSSLAQATVEDGWPYSEVVNSANFNEIMRRATSILASAESYGVMAWSALTSYVVGALVTGSDGVVYEAVTGSIGYDPSIDPGTRWRRYVPEEVQLLIGKSLASSDDVIDNFPAGTVMSFYQAAPPTGWTLKTTNNDAFLRVVSTAGGGIGGTASAATLAHAHTNTFANVATALSIAQMPAHTHTMAVRGSGGGLYFDINYTGGGGISSTPETSSTGSGGTHNHTLNGSVSSASISPKYINVINCIKN